MSDDREVLVPVDDDDAPKDLPAGILVGKKIDDMLKAQESMAKLRKFLESVYNKTGGKVEDIKSFTDEEVLELAGNLTNGVPTATPVFDGAGENEIAAELARAWLLDRAWQVATEWAWDSLEEMEYDVESLQNDDEAERYAITSQEGKQTR